QTNHFRIHRLAISPSTARSKSDLVRLVLAAAVSATKRTHATACPERQSNGSRCHRFRNSLDSNPQSQRPNDAARLFRVTPRGAEFICNFVQWIAIRRSDEPLSRRPASKVAAQIIEIPPRCHFEYR